MKIYINEFLSKLNKIIKFKHSKIYINVSVSSIILNTLKKFDIFHKKNIANYNKNNKKINKFSIFSNSEKIIYNILSNKKNNDIFSLNNYRYCSNFLFHFLGYHTIKIKKKLTRMFSNLVFIFKRYNSEKKLIGYNSGLFFICKPHLFLSLNFLELSINSNLTIINDINGVINSHCFQIRDVNNLFAHEINSISDLQYSKKFLKFTNTTSFIFRCRLKFISQLVKSIYTQYYFISIPNSSFNNSQLLNLKNKIYKKSSYYGFTCYLKKYLLNLVTIIKKKKKN
mmetsp:Transcript_4405/g.8831  ORF Transcript_4405/g.8831 Transcript_4405/m.8831 type:complete len:283 (+) Transcript_4405:176-1024(+)